MLLVLSHRAAPTFDSNEICFRTRAAIEHSPKQRQVNKPDEMQSPLGRAFDGTTYSSDHLLTLSQKFTKDLQMPRVANDNVGLFLVAAPNHNSRAARGFSFIARARRMCNGKESSTCLGCGRFPAIP
jgi:hypothetical protein